MTDGASLLALAQAAGAGAVQPDAQGAGATAPAPAQQTQPSPSGPEARFAEAMDRARSVAAAPLAAEGPAAVAPAMQGVMDRLSAIDGRAQRLAEEAKAAELSGSEFTPGEMVMLSVRAHEFMFHAQLTSNMANRTSDGLQQLFRQQS